MSLARRNAASLFGALVQQLQQDDACPGCSEKISWTTSSNGLSVEILHPQPPCEGFREFVDKLKQRFHRGSN